MCLMAFGALPHARVLSSLRLVGEALLPELASGGRGADPA
jgi:hypothetical protein